MEDKKGKALVRVDDDKKRLDDLYDKLNNIEAEISLITQKRDFVERMQRKETQTVYDRMADPMTTIAEMGKWFASSNMLGVKTPDQGKIIALTCMIEHITPLEFIRTYDIIDGKPAKKAAAMQAEFQYRGGRVKWHKFTDEVCSATIYHKDYAPDGVPLEITMDELEKRGITKGKNGIKDNYFRSPRQMLKARVISELIRMVDPEINAGLYTPEELEDQKIVEAESIQDAIWNKEEPKEEPITASKQMPKKETKSKKDKKKETKKNDDIEDRKTKAVSMFKSFDLLLEDLEKLLGLPFAKWGIDEVDQLALTYTDIKNANDDERDNLIIEIFGFEPGEYK